MRCIQVGTLHGETWDKMHEQSRRVYSPEGAAPTIHTMGGGGQTPFHNYDFRIRKLTPKECFRLMDFDDEDIDKCKAVGMSDSQLYKQAGNSIVVAVLEAIFGQLFDKE